MKYHERHAGLIVGPQKCDSIQDQECIKILAEFANLCKTTGHDGDGSVILANIKEGVVCGEWIRSKIL